MGLFCTLESNLNGYEFVDQTKDYWPDTTALLELGSDRKLYLLRNDLEYFEEPEGFRWRRHTSYSGILRFSRVMIHAQVTPLDVLMVFHQGKLDYITVIGEEGKRFDD